MKIVSPALYERAVKNVDPSAVVIGPGLSRTTTTDPRAYDKEVEYDLTGHSRLAEEVNGVEERRNGRKSDSFMVEESLRQYELTAAAMAKHQWQGQERWQGREQFEARYVNIMQCREFVRRLARVDVKVWLNDFSKLGRIGVNARVLESTGYVDRTLTTLHYPWSIEWSIMRFDRYNVPINERFRGWRTALLTLIVAGVVTESQAVEAFGHACGLPSAFYLQTLYEHRNRRWNEETPVSSALGAGPCVGKFINKKKRGR